VTSESEPHIQTCGSTSVTKSIHTADNSD